MNSLKSALGGLFSRVDNVYAYAFAFYAILASPVRVALHLLGTEIPYDTMLVVGAALTLILFGLTYAGGLLRYGKTYRPESMHLMALALVGFQILPTYKANVVSEYLIFQTINLEGMMLVVATAIFGKSWFMDVLNLARAKGAAGFDLLKNDLKTRISARTTATPTPMPRQPEQVTPKPYQPQELPKYTPVERKIEQAIVPANLPEAKTSTPDARIDNLNSYMGKPFGLAINELRNAGKDSVIDQFKVDLNAAKKGDTVALNRALQLIADNLGTDFKAKFEAKFLDNPATEAPR